MDDSSELKYENGEGLGSFSKHVRSQMNINGDNIVLFDESYVDTVCVVEVELYFYFECTKTTNVDLK